MLSPHAAEIEYLCTWEVWCSTDLSRQNRALLIGGTLLIPLKGYRACWKELKSSTGIYFSSKLCMQNSHKKGGLMNLSCPELALHLLADLLWLRHMAHELPHPCPPPPSSSEGERMTMGSSQLQTCCQYPLSCAILWQGASGPAAPGRPLPTPWLRLPMQGHQPQCWDPSGSPSWGPEQQHCGCLGMFS